MFEVRRRSANAGGRQLSALARASFLRSPDLQCSASWCACRRSATRSIWSALLAIASSTAPMMRLTCRWRGVCVCVCVRVHIALALSARTPQRALRPCTRARARARPAPAAPHLDLGGARLRGCLCRRQLDALAVAAPRRHRLRARQHAHAARCACLRSRCAGTAGAAARPRAARRGSSGRRARARARRWKRARREMQAAAKRAGTALGPVRVGDKGACASADAGRRANWGRGGAVGRFLPRRVLLVLGHCQFVL